MSEIIIKAQGNIPRIVIGSVCVCTDVGKKNPYYIHIWRKDFPNNSCKHVFNILAGEKTGDDHSHSIDYMDGYELTIKQLDNLAKFLDTVRGADCSDLVVHCYAGYTRSPTIALFALHYLKYGQSFSADTFYINMVKIYVEYYNQARDVPNICQAPIQSIIAWLNKGPKQ